MSVQFSGAGYYQYATTGFPLVQGAKSVCMWLYLVNNSTLQGLFNATDGATTGYQIGIRSVNTFTVWNYGGSSLITVVPPLTNVWTHVTYTYDGTTHTIYFNGIVQGTSTIAAQNGTPTNCQIGGNQWNELVPNAQIEDVRLYNRVLGINEILSVMNCNQRDLIVNGLSAWWPMDGVQEGLTLPVVPEVHGLTCSLINTAAAGASSMHLQERS